MYNLKVHFKDGTDTEVLCDNQDQALRFLKGLAIQSHTITRITGKTPGPIGLAFRRYEKRGLSNGQSIKGH